MRLLSLFSVRFAFVVLFAALRVSAEGPEPVPTAENTPAPTASTVTGAENTPAAAPAVPAAQPPAAQPPAEQNAAIPPGAVAPPPAPPIVNDEPVTLNLADASLDAVLKLMEMWTDRSILRPQTLPTDTYSLVLDKPIPKSEAIRALETLLGLHGIGVITLDDRFLKVVPLPQASREAPELITGSTLDMPPSGRIAGKLFQLQFLRVNEIIPPLQQIMSPAVASPPVLFENANAALIVDSITNLQRIEMLLKKVDQPLAANISPRFYQVRYAQASDLVNKIHAIFQGPLQAQIGSSTIYNADDRTNQIILISDPRQFPLFDSLIAKLDIKADPNTRNEVIYLKHAAAKDVASLLGTLISGEASAAQKSGGQNGGRPLEPQPGTPNQPPPLAAIGGKSEATGFSSYVNVVPDDRSNAIVVSGTSDDIRLVQEVVNKIDVLLAQVSIQVIIAEVTLNDKDTSGINALSLTVGTDNFRGTHITNFAADSNGITGWNVTSGVVNPLAFQAALNNTGNKSNVRILSADTVTTTHAKEADFKVTQQQPIITGSTSVPLSNGATTAPTTVNNGFSTSSQVNYKDIGIEVKVTPLIGNDGSIQLQIDQTVDDVVSNVTIDGNTQPIIGHREATSNVTVQDGQMVVLGGLQQSKLTNSRTKLGLLFEIPILSNLLGGRDHEMDRTELLFFVRPHIIAAAMGTADTNKRIDELSNKDQIHEFLQDPTKPPKETILQRYYK
ncbi:MAG TPA: secretin N-terminal domain-containing protein [Opitutaceae bacterium]|nr:secretin N-terminal domain-containing protein [Opitutaceae bacterium]